MKSLLVVYHSMTGSTLQMAHAAAAGARLERGILVALPNDCERTHAGNLLTRSPVDS